MKRVIDTSREARDMYQTFMDRPSRRQLRFDWTWPAKMQHVGEAKAQMYKSNKWKKNLDDWEAYKHIAEDYQDCYITPGFLVSNQDPNRRLTVHGPLVEFERPMPKHFAILAPCRGVQIKLFDEREDLPRGDDNLYQVDVRHAYWGGAIHPATKEHFLFLFSKEVGVGLVITGDSLAITKDGIVG
jgi:hypothetical protein